MGRLKIVATWLLQVLVGVLFVVIGVAKFGDPSWARNFARWGYPAGFHLVIGVVEAAAGLALLVPRLASYAASALAVVMAGAAVTHLVHGEMRRLVAPLVYLALVCLLGWLRRGSALRLRDRHMPPAGVAGC